MRFRANKKIQKGNKKKDSVGTHRWVDSGEEVDEEEEEEVEATTKKDDLKWIHDGREEEEEEEERLFDENEVWLGLIVLINGLSCNINIEFYTMYLTSTT